MSIWREIKNLGFVLAGKINPVLYIWAAFGGGKKSLWFWDDSQTGSDCCYGKGKWMPVKDKDIIDSFPDEFKDES